MPNRDHPLFADSLGFLAPPGQPPIFDPSKMPQVALAHVTSVPPIPAMHDFNTALAAHNQFREQALNNPGVHEVLTKADLDKPGLGLVFGLQHAPNGLTLDRVRQLFDAGVRVMQLAYDRESEYGSGYKAEGGLTKRGGELLRWMAEVGMILDLAHLNHQTAIDVIMFLLETDTSTNVMVSHTGCNRMHGNWRNIKNTIFRGVRILDGYVGLSLMNFMTGGADLDGISKHIDHAMRVCDHDASNIGIGSDAPHLDRTMAQAKEGYDNLVTLLGDAKPEEVIFPDLPREVIEHGSELFPRLRQAMPHLPDGVFGQNFRDFLARSLPQA